MYNIGINNGEFNENKEYSFWQYGEYVFVLHSD